MDVYVHIFRRIVSTEYKDSITPQHQTLYIYTIYGQLHICI